MAIEKADLEIGYSELQIVDINQSSTWPMLMDRSYESQLQGKDEVVIQKYDYNTDPENRNRGDSFDTPKESSATQLRLTVNNRMEQANSVDYEDLEEVPVDLLNPLRASQMATMAAGATNSIDRKLHAAFTGSNFTGQTATFGAAGTDFIARTGAYEGTGRGYGLVHDCIRHFFTYLQRQNAYDGTFIGGNGVGRPWVKFHPELHAGYSNWLAEHGFHWDTLTSAALVQGSVLSGETFGGRILGIDIYVSNNYTVPPANGMWTFHAGTTQCWTLAFKAPYVRVLSPMENQDGPEWVLRQIVRMADLELNPTLKHEYKIRAV